MKERSYVKNLKQLPELLLKNDVDFVLNDGFAAVVHVSTIVTQDIDILLINVGSKY